MTGLLWAWILGVLVRMCVHLFKLCRGDSPDPVEPQPVEPQPVALTRIERMRRAALSGFSFYPWDEAVSSCYFKIYKEDEEIKITVRFNKFVGFDKYFFCSGDKETAAEIILDCQTRIHTTPLPEVADLIKAMRTDWSLRSGVDHGTMLSLAHSIVTTDMNSIPEFFMFTGVRLHRLHCWIGLTFTISLDDFLSFEKIEHLCQMDVYYGVMYRQICNEIKLIILPRDFTAYGSMTGVDYEDSSELGDHESDEEDNEDLHSIDNMDQRSIDTVD